MVSGRSEYVGRNWRGGSIGAVTALAVLVAFLVLDGQLGPLSFTLRRAIAIAVLAAIALPSFVRGGRREIRFHQRAALSETPTQVHPAQMVAGAPARSRAAGFPPFTTPSLRRGSGSQGDSARRSRR
jgi:hypothetical protein